ncbi:MAG: ferritin-like domain-containing protein [Oscillospiraceae bacterium]|nr:ferritin-like domain-containing protein [Oscillospiraceae bacterium]
MQDHTAYDYRMYDNVWQRVSPGCDPYGDGDATPNMQHRQSTSLGESMSTQMAQVPQMPQIDANGEDTLPGAEINPCCMGSEAEQDLKVLVGFIEEELAQRRCYLGLSHRLCHSGAAQLLRSIAQEKKDAARELKTAYFLITGCCYQNAVSIDHMRWHSLADALRSIYHQEACNAFNYRRAADESVDPCLQKIFDRLSVQAFARADALMELLGQMLC